MPAVPARPQNAWGRDRFYTIDGHRLPSVTTVLDIIAKPALGPWYAKEERRYFETAMLEVLSRPGARDPEYVLAARRRSSRISPTGTPPRAPDFPQPRASSSGFRSSSMTRPGR
jgi:hypothetical protein